MDRVGFPKDYAQTFEVLRVVNKPKEKKVITVYGNKQAASITNSAQLPYPYGSIIVMETAQALQDEPGRAGVNVKARPPKGSVTGLHVMRREAGFGKGYGRNQAGEWEFVEYKPDGSYLTAPDKSASCAECHVKAGMKTDFVYKGRLAAE